MSPKLHAEKYEDLIDRRGRQVQWEEATTCSCWNLDSGQPTYSCKACGGKGYVYQAPAYAKVAVTSVTLNHEYTDMAGVFEVGDAVMTVPKRIRGTNGDYIDNPMFDIGEHDRITLLDDAYKTSEILVKGIPVGHRDPDTLLNDQVTSIKRICSFNIITGDETVYELGKDYSLSKNVIEWIADGKVPDEGEQYSVTYFHRPVYTVIATLPKPRHQDEQDLPRYVALRYVSGAVDAE